MELMNKVLVSYSQILPDGTTKLLSAESNAVTTNIIARPIKPIYTQATPVIAIRPHNNVFRSFSFDFLYLFLLNWYLLR